MTIINVITCTEFRLDSRYFARSFTCSVSFNVPSPGSGYYCLHCTVAWRTSLTHDKSTSKAHVLICIQVCLISPVYILNQEAAFVTTLITFEIFTFWNNSSHYIVKIYCLRALWTPCSTPRSKPDRSLPLMSTSHQTTTTIDQWETSGAPVVMEFTFPRGLPFKHLHVSRSYLRDAVYRSPKRHGGVPRWMWDSSKLSSFTWKGRA